MFISSSSKIAHHFKISGYTISFLLVAIATSLPETVVGITSALEGNPILSYGNAMGSNIALLTVIIAIPGILNSGIKTREIFRTNDIYYTALFSLMSLSLTLDGSLSRIDGAALVVAYVVYITVVLRRSHGLESIFDALERVNVWKEAVFFAISLVILLGASEGIVRGAENVSLLLGLSLGFVGLTLTAIGTSLPEIAYAVGAVKEDKEKEVLGDVIGSVVANSTLVLGITSLIYPIDIFSSKMGAGGNYLLIAFMAFTLLTFLRFMKTERRLDKKESIILFLLYLVFIVLQYNTAR